MKKQALISTTAIAATLASGMAYAELSANLGVVSTYVFRGVVQSGTAGQGGLDYDFGNGFSVGTWGSDVGGQGGADGTAQGIEWDLYGGYGGSAGDIDYSIGATMYLYTGDFDTSYTEVNLGAGFGPVAVDVAIGSHEQIGVADNDYTFISVSGDIGPVAATYGTWGGDYSGGYIELGIGTDIGGADAGLSIINSDADNADAKNFVTDGTTLVFSLSKGFEL